MEVIGKPHVVDRRAGRVACQCNAGLIEATLSDQVHLKESMLQSYRLSSSTKGFAVSFWVSVGIHVVRYSPLVSCFYGIIRVTR